MAADGEEEEDDYLTMTFDDSASAPETSLQRRQREKREAEQRGRVKSKAELAAEVEAERERGLATSLLQTPHLTPGKGGAGGASKGLAMMARMGFKGGALGAADNAGARTEPLRLAVKEDRGGIGLESEKRKRLREAAEAAEGQAKRTKAEEGDYRERVRREREQARWERQLRAAQMVAERMDEEREEEALSRKAEKGAESGKSSEERDSEGNGIGDQNEGRRERREPISPPPRKISSRPLKSINVLWRGLARTRDEVERERRMRYDLEQSLSRLPTYENDDEDEDDKKALGKTKERFVVADDLDDEDPELDEFDSIEVDKRLEKVVLYLRSEYRYCFWCKATYPDDAMEGCPGPTEEDHD